jgi:fermentation-respiration switch protein FrsA (DUF1100 family)
MSISALTRLTPRKAFLLTILSAAALALSGQGNSPIAGIWVGDLKVQSSSITLVLNVTEENGKLKATLDSPGQGAMGIPVSSISFAKPKLKFESMAIRGSFVGELSPDGATIAGTWSQGGQKFPLSVERREGVPAPAMARPQEPKPPFPYAAEDVTFENKKAGIRLAGTLIVPKAASGGAASFPAAVFATGSGPQNRDEELLGHKPFLVIADYLARRGIASLRFDDRGVGSSKGKFETATTLDFADDVEAAFEYLASRPEVNKGAVGIIGHSEGGLIAPIVASRNPRVSFVVLLAGPGIAGEDILNLQGELIARASGSGEEEIARAKEINSILYGIAKGTGSAASIKAKAKKAYLDWADSNGALSAEERKAIRANADGMVAAIASPWFRSFLSLDPAPYLAKVGQPLLALNGSKDLQVPPAEDLAGIRAALGPGANPKNALVELPGLNHLFQRAVTGSPEEYGKIEETIAPEALQAIGDWILKLWE